MQNPPNGLLVMGDKGWPAARIAAKTAASSCIVQKGRRRMSACGSSRPGMSARRSFSRGKRTLHEQAISVAFDPFGTLPNFG